MIQEGIDQIIAGKVRATINKYSLLDKNELSLIAISGGKDSLTLVKILNELGYKFIAAVVDFGYPGFPSKKITEITKSYGSSAIIIKARDSSFLNTLPISLRDKIKGKLSNLDSLGGFKNKNITPCTDCYNVKILVLEDYARRKNIRNIIFGHHGTDAIVSLLKSYFMYIDYHLLDNHKFDKDRFARLVYKTENFNPNVIKKLVKKDKISTDEPPVEYLGWSNYSVRIVRPLFEVFESQIELYKNIFQLKIIKDKCFFSRSSDNLTAREIVQKKLGEISAKNTILEFQLLDIVKLGLKIDGTLKVRAREIRDKIIPGYKVHIEKL